MFELVQGSEPTGYLGCPAFFTHSKPHTCVTTTTDNINSSVPNKQLSLKELFLLAHDWREFFFYLFVWVAVILSIFFGQLYDQWSGRSLGSFWQNITADLLGLLPYFCLFLLNDVLLTLFLVRTRKLVVYSILAILLALGMTLVVEMLVDDHFDDGRYNKPPFESNRPDGQPLDDYDYVVPDNVLAPSKPTPPDERIEPAFWDNKRHFIKPPGINGVLHLGPMATHFTIALLLISLGIMVKSYMLSERDKQRLREMDHEKMKAELAQLRYQVSPHFMMNTLNNIHALVDIDAERAKLTIEQLSRLMRHLLYESDRPLTHLDRDIQFLRDYVNLMSIRYTDNVKVSLSLPSDVGHILLPPLLFVNMVENAFKHGVSYAHPSFINVVMTITNDGKGLDFLCVNSLCPNTPQDKTHGIGLVNLRRRLDMLCPNAYRLTTQVVAETFEAHLVIDISVFNS